MQSGRGCLSTWTTGTLGNWDPNAVAHRTANAVVAGSPGGGASHRATAVNATFLRRGAAAIPPAATSNSGLACRRDHIRRAAVANPVLPLAAKRPPAGLWKADCPLHSSHSGSAHDSHRAAHSARARHCHLRLWHQAANHSVHGAATSTSRPGYRVASG
jgi:hypothetical protein